MKMTMIMMMISWQPVQCPNHHTTMSYI